MTGGAEVFRRSLWPFGPVYGAVAGLRNVCFDRGLRHRARLEVPVLSVGNLTTGGTGKTPMVIWLVEQLRAIGRRPGVLARGYGRKDGAKLNDEGLLLQGRFPDLPQEQDPDRVSAGRRLQEQDVDCILLDDGFQHRRLKRDFDVLCLDARRPFGRGGFLPAGDLREGPRSMRRAHAIVLTRAGGVAAEALRARADELRRTAGVTDAAALPVYFADHKPRDVVYRDGSESKLSQPSTTGASVGTSVATLRERKVVLLSGIARPDAFAATVEELGAVVADQIVHRDHHWFSADELRSASDRAQALDALLLTTEKDEVRIAACEISAAEAGPSVPRGVLRIDLEFVGEPLVWSNLDSLAETEPKVAAGLETARDAS